MIMIMSLVIVLKIGVLGRNLLDEHREWWSRVGAWLTIVNLSWIVLFAFAMYSAYVFALADTAIKQAIVASGGLGWALWTGAGVLLGKDSGSAGGIRAALKNHRLRRWIVDMAPFVFIVGLLAVVSTAAFWLVIGVSPVGRTYEILNQPHWSGIGLTKHWLLAGPGLLLCAFLLSCRVDVNEFSMHHFYKNRLVRCYLGASREGTSVGALRSPDPFTGLDPADDVKLAELRVEPGECDPQIKKVIKDKQERNSPYVGPLPIINVALNLVTGGDLAWQERKAQSFSFTPIFSGYEYRVPSRQRPGRFANQGFRSSFLYGYPPFGIGLGTAVAISGAAASPNMGYHSSPALGFLMTVFNALLGWWMGNPRDKFNWLRSTPRRGLLYLVNELLGFTSDDTHFVNLSDGGHFENLGVYELVRRRCRYIVACDAEQDSALSFNGLGNAIRKCRLDLGTEITVRATRIHPLTDTQYSSVHTVIGDIRYPDGQMGTLVYLKASLTGDEPTDVLEYGTRQHAFPHQSTADQFFDESQFESYRKLGVHVAKTTFALPFADEETPAYTRLDRLSDYWYPANAAIEDHFSDHATQYDELLERVRKDPNLALIDAAFFGEAVPPGNQRDPMFLGVALLDLMQRIFIDLDLEHASDHPHNKGWMAIFRQWRKLDAVKRAWTATQPNYGRRFQWFVEHL